MAEPMKVAFLGLGVMGYPMAGHLAKAGHEVSVYNRTAARAAAWVDQHGGAAQPTPAAAADGCALVFACVGNDDDVRSVMYGDDGAFAGMVEGAILIDHTTASATLARELSEYAKGRGLDFLDGPVSGGQAGAENGALTVMTGGEQAAFDKAAPVIEGYARAVTLMGVRHATCSRIESRAPIRFPTRTLAPIATPSGNMNVKLAMLITT